jgi:hypothetical protein
MKIAPILGIIILLFVNCNRTSTFNDLKLSARIIDVGWDQNEYDQLACYQYVKIDIKNDSKFTKSIWIMSRSWQQSFLTDVKNMKFLSPAKSVSNNYPIQIQLKPDESITFSNIMSMSDSIRSSRFFRIGFLMYSKNDFMHMDQMDQITWQEHLKSIKIYWSNYLQLLPGRDDYLGYDEK